MENKTDSNQNNTKTPQKSMQTQVCSGQRPSSSGRTIFSSEKSPSNELAKQNGNHNLNLKLISPPQKHNQDWMFNFSIAVCEKTDIHKKLADDIRVLLEKYLQSSPKKFQADLLPIASLKISLIQTTFFDLLPTYLIKEVKFKINAEIQRMRSYSEEKDVDHLIDCITDDLMQDPSNFQEYNFYFSSKDQKEITSFLEKDPLYLTHLELWKDPQYQSRMVYESGKTLEEIEMNRMKNPKMQMHSIILRHKKVIDRAFKGILLATQDDYYSQSKIKELIALLKEKIETYFYRHFQSPETSSKSISLKELKEVHIALVNSTYKFIHESLRDLDSRRLSLIREVMEMKIKLCSKLIKSEINSLKNLILLVLNSEIASLNLKEQESLKLKKYSQELVASNGQHTNSKTQLSSENTSKIISKLKEFQEALDYKVSLEREYTNTLQEKYKDSYYFRLAEIAIDTIGANPLVVLDLFKSLPKFCEKQILNLRSEDIKLSRNRLIELDNYLSRLLQMKKLMNRSDFGIIYQRNKVRSQVLEKLCIYLPEETESLRFQLTELILEGNILGLDPFRGYFTNQDFTLLKSFLETNKLCQRYFEAIAGKGTLIFKGTLNPYEIPKGFNLEEEELVENHQNLLNRTQKIEKQLEKLTKYDLMPECAEKYLARLVTEIEAAQIDNSVIKGFNLEKEFENLRIYLKIEGLHSSELDELLEKGQKKIESKEWEQAKGVLLQVFKKVRVLDFSLILELVKEADNASILMEDKPILIFLGKTGSGKSTAIHFLAGSTLSHDLVEGMPHIQIVPNPRIESLRKLTTSPNSVSETRYVIPITIEDPAMSNLLGSNNDEVILCDTPGFGDTRSIEMDLANSLSVVTALKKAKCVKPVVVISYKSLGDRLQGLRDLVQQLAGLQDQEPNFKSFVYLFTKFPKKERENASLIAMLENLKAISQEDGKNEIFITFLDDVLKKTKTKKGVMFFDPLSVDERDDLVEMLGKISPIEYPHDFFKTSFTPASEHLLKKQLTLHEEKILIAAKRHDFAYVCFRFDELKELYEFLNYQPVHQSYERSVDNLRQLFLDQFEKAKEDLHTRLLPQNELLESDIQQYHNAMSILKAASSLITKHLMGGKMVSEKEYIKNITTEVQNLRSEIQIASLEKANLQIVRATLEKLSIISKFFPHIQKQVEDACKNLKDQFNQARKDLYCAMKDLKYEKFTSEFAHIQAIFIELRTFLKLPDFQMEDDKSKFLAMIKEDAASAGTPECTGKIVQKDIIRQKEFLERMQTLTSDPEIKKCLDLDELKKITDNLLMKIYSIYDFQSNLVNELISSPDSDYETEEQCIQEMSWFREIPAVEARTQDSYNKMLGVIIGKIQDFNSDINTLLSQKDDCDYTKIVSILSKLEKLKWIEKYTRRNECQNYIEKTRKNILLHLDEQHTFIQKNSEFDPENYPNTIIALHRFCKLKDFKISVSSVPEIQKKITEIEEDFTKKVQKSLNSIDQTIKQSEKDPIIQASDIEKTYCFLDTCKNIEDSSREKASKLFESLKKYLADKYGGIIQIDINDAFESVANWNLLQKETLGQFTQTIWGRLQELEEYKESCPKIFSCLATKKIFEKFIDELSVYREEMTHNFAGYLQENRIQEIVTSLSIVKALSKFDTYLKDDKFAVLHKQQRESLYTHIKKINEEYRTALKKGDYPEAADLLKLLKVDGDSTILYYYKDATKCLNKHAQQVFREAMDLIDLIDRRLSLPEVQSCLKKLKEVEKLCCELRDFLDKPEGFELEPLYQTLASFVDPYFRRLTALRYAYRFAEFEKALEHLLVIVYALGRWCDSDIKNQIEILCDRENMLEEIVRNYKNLDIDKYSYDESPKEVLENLIKASEVNPEYLTYASKIRKIILAKFRETLRSEKNGCVKKYESALFYVPDDLSNILRAELKEFK